MPNTPAMVSLAPLPPRVDVCALCSSGPESLRNAVVVRHLSGATVDLAACDRCAMAVRRLVAAAGGATAAGPAQMVLQINDQPAAVAVETSSLDTVGEPVVIHTQVEPFLAEDGVAYTVTVWGQERTDGTWIGWLVFAAPDAASRPTPRETSQSNREHLAYWATGLQVSYLEGAFARASP